MGSNDRRPSNTEMFECDYCHEMYYTIEEARDCEDGHRARESMLEANLS